MIYVRGNDADTIWKARVLAFNITRHSVTGRFFNVIPTWNLKFFPVEPARGFLGDEGQSHCFTAT